MKKLLIISIITLSVFAVNAQTVEEWVSQKKTQIKYLVQQIANLQAQIIQLKKGYDVAKDGWNMIHDMTNGEFTLHKDYFDSLDKPSTAIDDDPNHTIAEIKHLIRISQ